MSNNKERIAGFWAYLLGQASMPEIIESNGQEPEEEVKEKKKKKSPPRPLLTRLRDMVGNIHLENPIKDTRTPEEKNADMIGTIVSFTDPLAGMAAKHGYRASRKKPDDKK